VDAALAWVGQIAEFIGKFFPRWIIIPVTMGGVKYVRGWKVVTMEPGIVWYWPVTTMIDTYPTVSQTDNLPSQTVESEDDLAFTVGGMVTYSVFDVAKLLTGSHTGTMRIQATTLAAIHTVCSRMTWQDLKREQRKGTLDTKLRNAAGKALFEFGVRVEECQLTDLARTRVYRLIQSTQQDAG
jgi:regulator of protease activity HflC (stomatin/prohibitin superfamily)